MANFGKGVIVNLTRDSSREKPNSSCVVDAYLTIGLCFIVHCRDMVHAESLESMKEA